MNLFVTGWATFGHSGDDRSEYRYAIGRTWSTGPKRLVIVGVNPSTADAGEDDATLRRCIGFGRAHGADGVTVVNLFAYRSPKVRDLATAAAPIGPGNDEALLSYCSAPGATVVCAWGPPSKVSPPLRSRFDVVPAMLRAAGVQLHVLRLTATGHPEHPLYLPSACRPVVWPDSAAEPQ